MRRKMAFWLLLLILTGALLSALPGAPAVDDGAQAPYDGLFSLGLVGESRLAFDQYGAAGDRAPGRCALAVLLGMAFILGLMQAAGYWALAWLRACRAAAFRQHLLIPHSIHAPPAFHGA